jgi:hypothetical protein
MALTAGDQQIENPAGIRPPIDIVSQKDVHRPGRRMGLKVGIDLREQLSQQIGAAVHISNGIHPYALRELRQSSSSRGRLRVQHL